MDVIIPTIVVIIAPADGNAPFRRTLPGPTKGPPDRNRTASGQISNNMPKEKEI